MKSLGKAVVLAALGCMVSQICGCASSSLAGVWHDPSFQTPPLGKMLVVAVRRDATVRRIWEDAFAGQLAKHGVVATPSYSLFPDAPPDTNQVIAAVQEHGFDGILVTLRLPTETNAQYIQGYTTTTEQDVRYSPSFQPDHSPSGTPYYDPYWRRYRTYFQEVEHPGYVDSQTVDVRAIDVTTTGPRGRLIWSATSRTPDPASVTDVQRGIVSLVLSELAQRSIIGASK